jgi:hypothetical protein
VSRASGVHDPIAADAVAPIARRRGGALAAATPRGREARVRRRFAHLAHTASALYASLPIGEPWAPSGWRILRHPLPDA